VVTVPSPAVPTYSSFDRTSIAFDVRGDGPDVLLHHGFAADADTNWARPGVVDALVAAGRRVITLDARGHGRSGKPHDPAAYEDGAMVRDARGLLDHLGVEAVDVVGYSMGSFVASRLVPDEPRTRRLVLGGVGKALLSGRPMQHREAIADALLADDPATVPDPTARGFRAFAEATGADRLALGACMRADPWSKPVAWDRITVPTLVLVGDRDTLVGPPEPITEVIAGARIVVVSGDHLSAVGDPAFTRTIVEFLTEAG
jgi:pimeloyl-ACP methyl ester carboxylesterase